MSLQDQTYHDDSFDVSLMAFHISKVPSVAIEVLDPCSIVRADICSVGFVKKYIIWRELVPKVGSTAK